MKEKIITIVGIVFVVLFVLNLATTFYFYKQYNENINAINQQSWLAKIKLDTLEKNSEGFKETMDTLAGQIKNYDTTISAMEEKIASSDTNTKDITSKMQSLKLDVEDWQKKYGNTLALITELREKTEKLATDIEKVAKGAGDNVDLGKISVESEGTATQ